MTLLAFAPVAYILASEGKFALAIIGWLGIHAVEPLPDQDFHLLGLTHRGISHSLLAVLVVGGVLGAIGWFLGDRLFDWVFVIFSTGETIWEWALNRVPEATTGVLTTLVPNIPPKEIVGAIQHEAGGRVNRRAFGLFGFAVGAGGILLHLLGDVITMRGIKPFLPFSHWRLSLSSLRADNPVANSALLGLGVVAIGVVVMMTVPGVLLGASAPANLSPVGVAAGENTTTSAPMTTLTTQAPTTNTTQNASAANASNATVTLSNQTTNGSTVTVDSVTLSQPGYVALQSSAYAHGLTSSEESTIAVSDRLSAGTHPNVTINVSHAPPGNYPGLNRSQLNETETLVATVITDSNANKRFDYVRSFGETDTLVTTNSTVVRDSARVRVPEPSSKATAVTVSNQTLKNQILVVERARLPNGGFLVVHNTSLRQGGDALGSVAGVSEYLSPGMHTDVGITVPASALKQTQVVTVRPALDTNGNRRYDFVRSGGFADVAYETPNHSAIINDTVFVRSPRSDAVSTIQTRETTPSSLTRTETSKPRPTTTATTVTNTTEETDSSTIFGISPVYLVVGVGILLVVLPTLGRRLR